MRVSSFPRFSPRQLPVGRFWIQRTMAANRGPPYLTMASWTGKEPLKEDDPEVFSILQKEKAKQKSGIVLIPSEVSHLHKQ